MLCLIARIGPFLICHSQPSNTTTNGRSKNTPPHKVHQPPRELCPAHTRDPSPLRCRETAATCGEAPAWPTAAGLHFACACVRASAQETRACVRMRVYTQHVHTCVGLRHRCGCASYHRAAGALSHPRQEASSSLPYKSCRSPISLANPNPRPAHYTLHPTPLYLRPAP